MMADQMRGSHYIFLIIISLETSIFPEAREWMKFTKRPILIRNTMSTKC